MRDICDHHATVKCKSYLITEKEAKNKIMKKITFLTLALIVGISVHIFGKVSIDALEYNSSTCNWNSWFEYPNKTQYLPSEDVYVRVKAQYYQHISYMELYVNGHYIRKESSAPYEWCKNSSGDNYLRNLTPGSYTLKVKIKDKCGQAHYIQRQITVVGINPNYCQFNNPLVDLYWLKNLKQSHSNWKIDQYNKNGKVFFKLYQCNVTHYQIYWYDCNGNLVCSHLNTSQPNGSVSGAQYIKCWWNPCNGGGGNNYCTWNSWFEYPQNNQSFNHGCNVYVKVKPQKYQDIAYMELYLNGQYIRKESHYPYEWCKGGGNGDYKLRNMSPGYYTLKVKIKDKCGSVNWKTCKFYVY